VQQANYMKIIQSLEKNGSVTVRGVEGLWLVRQAIEATLAQAGCAIAFDPDSEADLVDYLTVTTASGLEGATLGAGLGGIVGLLVNRFPAGVLAGAVLGLIGGAARGVRRVETGWRVRAVRELNGLPRVTITAAR
jgi:hypothetical protein